MRLENAQKIVFAWRLRQWENREIDVCLFFARKGNVVLNVKKVILPFFVCFQQAILKMDQYE